MASRRPRLGVEFHLSQGDWIRLLNSSGFEIKDLVAPLPAGNLVPVGLQQVRDVMMFFWAAGIFCFSRGLLLTAPTTPKRTRYRKRTRTPTRPRPECL